MPETLIGYARCSTDEQDLTARQQRLTELGVSPETVPDEDKRERAMKKSGCRMIPVGPARGG